MLTKPVRILLGIMGFAALFLVVLNLLVDPTPFWAIWPIWAFSMVAGAMIGVSSWRNARPLGLWIGFGLPLVLGLFAIDLSTGGNWWFFWPAGVWLILTLIFIGLSVDILGAIPTSRPATDEEIEQREARD